MPVQSIYLKKYVFLKIRVKLCKGPACSLLLSLQICVTNICTHTDRFVGNIRLQFAGRDLFCLNHKGVSRTHKILLTPRYELDCPS